MLNVIFSIDGGWPRCNSHYQVVVDVIWLGAFVLMSSHLPYHLRTHDFGFGCVETNQEIVISFVGLNYQKIFIFEAIIV